MLNPLEFVMSRVPGGLAGARTRVHRVAARACSKPLAVYVVAYKHFVFRSSLKRKGKGEEMVRLGIGVGICRG